MKNVGKLFVGLYLIMFAIGCAAATPKIRINYDLDPATPTPKTIKDVTIDIEYVDFNEGGDSLVKRFPYLKKTVKELTFMGDIQKKERNLNPFWKKIAFYVKIKNDTDHILRMSDARIFFVNGEDTFPALKKDQWKETFESDNPKGPSGLTTDVSVPGYYNDVLVLNNSKFTILNDIGVEILPGFTKKGFICFDLEPQIAVKGTLSFFDITTKVDKVGAPLEKARFDFKITQKVTQIPVN